MRTLPLVRDLEKRGSKLHLLVVIDDAPRRRPLELVTYPDAVIELAIIEFRPVELSSDVLRRTLAAR